MPRIIVENLTRTYGRANKAVDNVSFIVEDGELFTLVGPSGCGKTTTLSCIAGLDNPTEGTISIGEREVFNSRTNTHVPCEERNVGMVFQTYALWPHMTVRQNLEVALKLRKVSAADRKRKIDDALDMVDLSKLGARYPHELSGGQQQRVALARALVYSPSVLLLDEPLSNLDAKLRLQARSWLKSVQRELGITTIYVTHDQDEALALSDTVAVMSGGHMLQKAPPETVYKKPASQDVAAFIGRMNFLPARVVEPGAGGKSLTTVQLVGTDDRFQIDAANDHGLSVGDEVTMAFRPEDVALVHSDATAGADMPNHIEGTIKASTFAGACYEYHLDVGGYEVEAFDRAQGLSGRCKITFGPQSVLLYPGISIATGKIDASASDAPAGVPA
ncbi:ABC transporter ATP-binding protein (plasmid) [Pseudohalocynthiibacter aestuariivivens]|nr:ABC transporter ATP-binding protein [Pseudohalocynthiibacter aestuariivivens]QIE48033.1 ABC transporter ATP-binding protein [Pseudohalocynthiibacter aestuariivivens]